MDLKRHKVLLRAMMYIFRSIDMEDWKDATLGNLEAKMKILCKVSKRDFRK